MCSVLVSVHGLKNELYTNAFRTKMSFSKIQNSVIKAHFRTA